MENLIIERTKIHLKTAEAFEKRLHEIMSDVQENATLIKVKGEKVTKEEDAPVLKKLQKDQYSFELLRGNMESTLGILKEYYSLIKELEITKDLTEKEIEVLETISKNNESIFELSPSGEVVVANNEMANMAFGAIDKALNSEESLDKILESLIKQK